MKINRLEDIPEIYSYITTHDFDLNDENDPVKQWIEELGGDIIKKWRTEDGFTVVLCEKKSK